MAHCDPIEALNRHLVVNDPPLDGHLFGYLKEGVFRPLTKRLFMFRCNKVWANFGIRHSGHAFRIGGTTELLSRGISPLVVQALGRWSSDTFLRYWRNMDNLADIHVGSSSSSIPITHAACLPSVGVCPSPGLTSVPSGLFRAVSPAQCIQPWARTGHQEPDGQSATQTHPKI
jgi:hypothetical protein